MCDDHLSDQIVLGDTKKEGPLKNKVANTRSNKDTEF